MHNGNTFWLNGVEDVFRRRRALIGIQTGGAHHHFVTTGGQIRVGRGWRNHQHAFVFIDIGSGLSRRRTQMADHVTDTVVDHFVRHGDGLFRVTRIVVFDANQFVAFYAAFGVDISDSLFCARKFHIAILGNRP